VCVRACVCVCLSVCVWVCVCALEIVLERYGSCAGTRHTDKGSPVEAAPYY
jgi:hypothetical protein